MNRSQRITVEVLCTLYTESVGENEKIPHHLDDLGTTLRDLLGYYGWKFQRSTPVYMVDFYVHHDAYTNTGSLLGVQRISEKRFRIILVSEFHYSFTQLINGLKASHTLRSVVPDREWYDGSRVLTALNDFLSKHAWLDRLVPPMRSYGSRNNTFFKLEFR